MASRSLGFALCATALALSACGDDLESRNEAVMASRHEPSRVTIEQPSRRDAPRPAATTATFSDDEDTGREERDTEGETVYVDAEPESLIDTTEGFAAEPMDDASGFDPAPMDEDDWGAED